MSVEALRKMFVWLLQSMGRVYPFATTSLQQCFIYDLLESLFDYSQSNSEVAIGPS